MAAFAYTTPELIKGYLDTDGSADDALLETCASAISRAIDTHCGQIFHSQTLSNQVLRAQIDRDGLLRCWPETPTMSTPTAAAYRIGVSTSWISLSTDAQYWDIEPRPSGCAVRVLGVSLGQWRDQRVQLKLSYSCGYADRAVLPADLAWYATLAAAAEYKKREAAGGDQTAIPSLGTVTTPRDWPPHVMRGLAPFVREIPL